MRTPRLLIFLVTLCSLTSCHDDLDDVMTQASDLEINEFIWRAMNNIYLYKSEVPELADNRFATEDKLRDFLNAFASPEDLFYGTLRAPQDRFSFLVDDYVELEKSLSGIHRSNGMEYGLVRYSEGSPLVLGYVRYVLPNTSAEAQGIARGDLFNTVDGVQLTDANYTQLLAPSTYSIGLAEIEGDEIIPTGESFTLQKEEYTENPVHITEILETSGGKLGYLFYTGFTHTFDPELNAAFAEFKSEGITELVLDLRYNGGGSVETAVDLASMITGQFEGEVFATQQWNEEYQSYFEEEDPERLINRFNTEIRTGEAINSLGLSRLFVIATRATASASELVINGLSPHIEVIQIGENTTGKFQASVTLYDSPDFGKRGANLDHRYALQPLVYKSANAAGKTDYLNGLAPDIMLSENIRELGVLGNPAEPLLEAALNAIEGKSQPKRKSAAPLLLLGESGMQRPTYQKMYIEEIPTNTAPEVIH